MPDMTVTVTGLDQFAAAVRRIGQQLPGAVGDELKTDLKPVLAKAVELAPLGVDYPGHKAGTLKASGFLDDPAQSGGHVVIAIGFNTGEGYELKQHELDYQHPRGGVKKFLQTPLEEWTGDGPERVVRRAVEGLGR